jgi:hypothetical protein
MPDPTLKKSRTETEDPADVNPYTLHEDPNLPAFLKERLDPTNKKSRTDIELPAYAMP